MKKIRVGIIGGTGGIGKWFARFFKNAGWEVHVSGRTSGMDLPTLAGSCPVVVVSVPIKATCEVIKEVGPFVPEESLLMDLTSLKEEPVKAMLASSKSEVIGLHPLFGPRIRSLAGHNIVICPARTKNWLPRVKGIFLKNGARLLEATPRRHDELMALVQGLNHLNTVSLGMALGRSGFTLEELSQYATPIFKTKLDIVKKVFNGNSRLYAEIITQNPHIRKAAGDYLKSLSELNDRIDRKDSRGLQKLMDRTRLFSSPRKT
jgi:prephenate dehydrogenase